MAHRILIVDDEPNIAASLEFLLLRDIAEGRPLGDTTTLADESVVDTIRENTGAAEE